MKFGFRKPNIKTSIKARTTGRIKRSMKRTINPFYGKKGMGFATNPKKAVYNKIYNKTSFGIRDVLNFIKPKNKKTHSKPKYSRKELLVITDGNLKIARESANLVNTTKTPSVFFERFDLLVEKLELLSEFENKIKLKGKLPSENLKEILENKELTINEFIDRYYNELIIKLNSLKTEKSKLNNIENFKKNLEIYNDKMSEKNIKYYMNLYNNIITNTR